VRLVAAETVKTWHFVRRSRNALPLRHGSRLGMVIASFGAGNSRPLPMNGLAMMDSAPVRAATPGYCDIAQPLEWRSRYDGLVAIAQIGDKAVAGISGPWSGKYALTWWERPLPARQLELYDTLEAAKREVEDWADRMSHAHALPHPVAAHAPLATREMDGHVGPFASMCTFLPDFPLRPRSSSSEKIDQLRRRQFASDCDPGDLHFAAND
jgi:hypothetical protein